MIFIGIDPGKNGGIALISSKKSFVYALPYSNDSLLLWLRGAKNTSECIAYVETVHAMPGQGVTSMFNFGKNYGYILGVLGAYHIHIVDVTPQKWKKYMEVTSDKNTSIDLCKRLFPDINLLATPRSKKPHDGMAEALLIAEYGRRHYDGKP